ncbi:carboxypeptidase-like regulatory domain-containing protein [Ohtaekwangia koreensis]|nr:carboxypeptidase-like regulatory domain-containing protein [Ohtaekwangia koreensis]
MRRLRENQVMCAAKMLVAAICLLSSPVLGQSQRGKIIDADTREPLEFSSIGVIGKNIGEVSNRDGMFELNVSSLADSDSVVITFLGYEPLIFRGKEFKQKDGSVFTLQPKAKVLRSVEITDQMALVEFGKKDKNKFKGFNGWGGEENAGKGKQLGLLVDVDSEILLNTISIHVEKNTYDSVLMRLHIYALNSNDDPTEELLSSNVLFTVDKHSGWVDIDVRPYRIDVAQDFCITLEWVKAYGKDTKGGMLTFSRMPNKPGISLYRGAFESDWTKQEGERAPAIVIAASQIEALTNNRVLVHRRSASPSHATLTANTAAKPMVSESSTFTDYSAVYKTSGHQKAIGLTKAIKSTEGASGLLSESSDESGTVIHVDKEYSLVDFNFHLRFNTFDSLLFKLCIYQLDDAGAPANLIAAPVEFRIGKKEGWQRINLESYKIVVTQDILVTLRLVDAVSADNKSKDLYFSKAIGTGYRRDIRVGEWSSNTATARALYLNVRD